MKLLPFWNVVFGGDENVCSRNLVIYICSRINQIFCSFNNITKDKKESSFHWLWAFPGPWSQAEKEASMQTPLPAAWVQNCQRRTASTSRSILSLHTSALWMGAGRQLFNLTCFVSKSCGNNSMPNLLNFLFLLSLDSSNTLPSSLS